jgi:hypothetical protein
MPNMKKTGLLGKNHFAVITKSIATRTSMNNPASRCCAGISRLATNGCPENICTRAARHTCPSTHAKYQDPSDAMMKGRYEAFMYDKSKYSKLYTLFATFKPCTNPNLLYEAHCFQGKFAKEVTVEDDTDNPLVAFMTQGLRNDSDTESSTSKPNDRGLSRMRPTSVDTSEDDRKPAARKSCDIPDEEIRKPSAKGCSIQKSHLAHREPYTKDQSHSSSDDDEPYDYKPYISKKSHAAQPPVPMFTPSYPYAPYGGYCAPAPPQMSHPPHQPYFAYPPMPQQVMNGHNPQFFGPLSLYVGGYSVATSGPTYYSGPPSAVYPPHLHGCSVTASTFTSRDDHSDASDSTETCRAKRQSA